MAASLSSEPAGTSVAGVALGPLALGLGHLLPRLPEVPVPLREDAPAVLLPVDAELERAPPRLLPLWPHVPVEELDAELVRGLLADPARQLVLLVGRDQEARRERVEAPKGRVLGRAPEAVAVA